eukprot:2789615-Karenia_brevis.AAC.1
MFYPQAAGPVAPPCGRGKDSGPSTSSSDESDSPVPEALQKIVALRAAADAARLVAAEKRVLAELAEKEEQKKNAAAALEQSKKAAPAAKKGNPAGSAADNNAGN